MKTIGIDQSLRNSALFEPRCLQNINKLHKHAGKCDDQKKFKDIIETTIASSPGVLTDNGPIYPKTSIPVKKPSTIKSIYIFTNILYVKKKTSIRRVAASKSKRKALKSRTIPWPLKPKQKVSSKINYQIKKSLYN